jgi:uncharacterized protein DUF397
MGELRWRKSSRSGSNGGNCVEVAVMWRKSSRSGGNGGHCVEVAAVWRKSSHSGSNGGDCVEVAGRGRDIAVRDSKNPDGPNLTFAAADWRAFTRRVKAGSLDLERTE